MKKYYLFSLFFILFAFALSAQSKSLKISEIPNSDFFNDKQNAYFFEFYDDDVDDDIIFMNNSEADIPVKAKLYAYYEKSEKSKQWILVTEVDFSRTDDFYDDFYYENYWNIGKVHRDRNYENKYRKTHYYALVPFEKNALYTCTVKEQFSDMFISISVKDYNLKAITFLGTWICNENGNKLNFFQDNTYSLETNNEIISIGYYVTKVEKIKTNNYSGNFLLFDFFHYKNGRITSNNEVSNIRIELDRDKIIITNDTSRTVEENYTFAGVNNEMPANGIRAVLENQKVSFDDFDYNVLYEDPSKINSSKKDTIDFYRSKATEEIKNQYLIYDSTYYKKSSLPQNVKLLGTIDVQSLYYKQYFNSNNPYNYEKGKLYKISTYGNVFQWLNSNSFLYDFLGSIKYTLDYTPDSLAYIYNVDGDDNIEYLIYEGVFNYTTTFGATKIVPKFKKVNPVIYKLLD